MKASKYGHVDELPDVLDLYFSGFNLDGVCAWSWQLFDSKAMISMDKGTFAGATDQAAEWMAVGRGVRWLADEGWKGDILTTHGTSIAVFNALTGRSCEDAFQAHLARCKALITGIGCKRFSTLLEAGKNEPREFLTREALREHGNKQKKKA